MIKILYFIAEDWYFCSHRLPIARKALKQGYEVHVVCRVTHMAELIKSEGFFLHPIDIQRGGLNLWHEIKTLLRLWRIYRQVSPTIAHQVALKPVLYGSIVARVTRVPHIVNALGGLGYLFTSLKFKARLLKTPVKIVLKRVLNQLQQLTIVQNPDDKAMLQNIGVADQQIEMIRGSGVNLKQFKFYKLPQNDCVVITLVARLLWSKGIGEAIEACRQLHRQGYPLRLQIVGDPDLENPDTIPIEQLRQWANLAFVDMLGHRKDIAQIWADSHIALLPSYREGLPKALLEAAACGRPIVTTDTPGCREIVNHHINGLLVPVQSVKPLVAALKQLLEDRQLCEKMGMESRYLVERYFSEEIIVDQTLKIYQGMLNA